MPQNILCENRQRNQACTQGGSGGSSEPPMSKKFQQFLIQKKLDCLFCINVIKKIKGVAFWRTITSAVPTAGPPLYLQLDLLCAYSWTSVLPTAGPPLNFEVDLHLQVDLRCTYNCCVCNWTSTVPTAGPSLYLHLDLHWTLRWTSTYGWISSRFTGGPTPTSGPPLYLQLDLH